MTETAADQDAVTVRPAVPADAQLLGIWGAALVALHHQFDAARFFGAGSATPSKYASFLERELGRPDAVVLVAEDRGSLVGYVYAAHEGRDYMSLRGPAGVIHDLFVDPARRGKGIGRSLLEAAIYDLKSNGAELLVLSTAYRNQAAQSLFAAVGFRPTMIEMTYGADKRRPKNALSTDRDR
ncbi:MULTISPECIES: GNAT family N-acetyltransferase [Rhizobium]|nr:MULTISPECIES: GNAT family N-acetyltransferase [Rhizobium]MCA0807012.1 GNAT family N-acetyltransferase [Rhizobium sp. T1473]MCS0461540.1 GNAT family N-acetyltransferase [Rhizobium favelukesii]UFS85542.1 GNAT family N-acetyltransferase [Rhizobium sp. T136]